MRKDLHKFTPGETAMMFGLRAHSAARDRDYELVEEPTVEEDERPSPSLFRQIVNTPARLKNSWRPRWAFRWRLAQK